MGLAAFKDIMQPRLKTLTPISPPGEFYRIFAQSLNDWFNVRVPLQYGTITGMVTTPAAGASYPFTGPIIKPQDVSLHLDWKVMKSFELTEEMIYPKILLSTIKYLHDKIISKMFEKYHVFFRVYSI